MRWRGVGVRSSYTFLSRLENGLHACFHSFKFLTCNYILRKRVTVLLLFAAFIAIHNSSSNSIN